MDKMRNPLKILNYKSLSRRPKGRPKKRWSDCLEEDLGAVGLTLNGRVVGRERMTLSEMASDRNRWRDIVRKSTTGYSHRTTT